jgi:hypothetical protein
LTGDPSTDKGALRPHLKKCWTIPSTANGEFAARMEDVLDVYARSYDPAVPVVCMDEKVRHEARCGRVEVRGLHRPAVAAVGLKLGAA